MDSMPAQVFRNLRRLLSSIQEPSKNRRCTFAFTNYLHTSTMNLKLRIVLVFTGLALSPIIAEQSKSEPTPAGPPDKQKVSYALGVNIGNLQKRSEFNARTDLNLFTQ